MSGQDSQSGKKDGILTREERLFRIRLLRMIRQRMNRQLEELMRKD